MNELQRVNRQRATLPTIIGQAPARFPIGGKIRAGIRSAQSVTWPGPRRSVDQR